MRVKHSYRVERRELTALPLWTPRLAARDCNSQARWLSRVGIEAVARVGRLRVACVVATLYNICAKMAGSWSSLVLLLWGKSLQDDLRSRSRLSIEPEQLPSFTEEGQKTTNRASFVYF